MRFSCDLIMCTLDQMDVLRPCVDSLVENTFVDARLILINDGGGERIRKYLDSLNGLTKGNIYFECVNLDKNVGFVKASNIGFGKTEAGYIGLLNNDLLFTKNWLSNMIRILDANPDIGLINPNSNHFGLKAPEGVSLDRFAEGLLKNGAGMYRQRPVVQPFCGLIRREIADRIGGFDPNFYISYYEDIDYCMRINRLGYKCVIASNIYVYHRRGMSQGITGREKAMERLRRNEIYFYKKWKLDLTLLIDINISDDPEDALINKIEFGYKNYILNNNVTFFIRGDNPGCVSFIRDRLASYGWDPRMFYRKRQRGALFLLLYFIAKRIKKPYDIFVSSDNRLLCGLTRFRSFFKNKTHLFFIEDGRDINLPKAVNRFSYSDGDVRSLVKLREEFARNPRHQGSCLRKT